MSRWSLRLRNRRHDPAAGDRFPPPGRGRLRLIERDDPITGLIAWPQFARVLPELMAGVLGDGRSLGVAIGDVDNLKNYVERANSADPASFGHIAGNAVMARLGEVARIWLYSRGPNHGCLATFGGDEVVLLAEAGSKCEEDFYQHVRSLRDALCAVLPCSVSFATGFMSPNSATDPADDQWWRDFTFHTIGAIDRSLIVHKNARAAGHPIPYGFIAQAMLTHAEFGEGSRAGRAGRR